MGQSMTLQDLANRYCDDMREATTRIGVAIVKDFLGSDLYAIDDGPKQILIQAVENQMLRQEGKPRLHDISRYQIRVHLDAIPIISYRHAEDNLFPDYTKWRSSLSQEDAVKLFRKTVEETYSKAELAILGWETE